MELCSVIKNDGPGKVLAWKFLHEDFNNNSQLIVAESEEALFMKDGIIVQTFPRGKYTLNTANYPFIGDLRNKMVFGGNSPFNCRVYFIDKAHKLELLWGTDSPIQMRDAEFGFMIGVRSRGSYSIQVNDAKKFLLKLVGNNVQVFSAEEFNNYFRSAFSMKIKTKLASVMKSQQMTVLDMSPELENIAEQMIPDINELLDEYGVRLVNFYISDISIPENDLNYAIINKAYADKGTLKVQGADWNKLAAKELLKDIANNPGAGGTAAAGMGIGMGFAANGMANSLAQQMFASLNQVQQPTTPPHTARSRYAAKSSVHTETTVATCPECQESNPIHAKFCNGCGQKILSGNIKCTQCGGEIPEIAKFCNECGARR